MANAVLSALARSELEHLSVYTEVMQDAVVELIDAGKVACASGTALTISPSARERFYAHIDDYKGKIILRPQELSNAPEVIRRLSIIAMNTAIEVDLAGNVNSTHIGEGAVMNGIGGSGDYARNSGIAIFSTASTAKDGAISCIVPHVAHVDHTEHDTEIIVTEQGLADLRGLTAYERAHVLIENCAHPKFRPGLREYVEQAYAQSKAKHGIIRL
ncbi:MAG: acetyl-CoA hydrolase/transferase C-terminal domain-containing protein [Flavonifractor plautii]